MQRIFVLGVGRHPRHPIINHGKVWDQGGLATDRTFTLELHIMALRRLCIRDLEPRIVLDAAPLVEGQVDDANRGAARGAGRGSDGGLPGAEITIIDGAAPDADQLAAAAAERGEVYVLDATRDGVAQISEILDGRSDLGALHIISHGGEGHFVLGRTVLWNETLEAERGCVRRAGRTRSARAPTS